jgi:hypothetical protein
MHSSAAGARIFRYSYPADLPCDAMESAMSLRTMHNRCNEDLPPERRLMIALVRDAIRSIERYRHARDVRGRRIFAEEVQWILSNDMSWFYAFARVCEVLDLNPESVRESLHLSPGTALRRSPSRSPRSARTPVIVRRSPC